MLLFETYLVTCPVSFSTSNSDRIHAARRYIVFFSVVLAILALLWGLGLPQLLPSRDSNWIAGMYATKSMRVKDLTNRKLVIVSGSSGLFGLSARLIEKRLGMPAVNFATHAGLGIGYLLFRARRVLNPGDVVFMSLEYELLAPRNVPGQTLARFITAHDPNYLFTAPIDWFPYFLTGHDHESLIWALVERLGLWRYQQACYGSAKSLNKFGDEMCAVTTEMKTVHSGVLGAQRAIKVTTINPLRFNNAIAEFFDWAKDNGVRVLVGFPPLVRRLVYSDVSYRRAFSAVGQRFRDFGADIIGKPEDSLYPDSHMYDTRYHLHSLGREVHTRRTLNLICNNAIECSD